MAMKETDQIGAFYINAISIFLREAGSPLLAALFVQIFHYQSLHNFRCSKTPILT
jgi:hypothetical protein